MLYEVSLGIFLSFCILCAAFGVANVEMCFGARQLCFLLLFSFVWNSKRDVIYQVSVKWKMIWLWERRVPLWKLSHVVARWDAMLRGRAASHAPVYLLPLASAFGFLETFFPCHFHRVCCLCTVHDVSVSLHFVVQWVCRGEMDVNCVDLGSAWLSI
jgi:hypothetical protein